MKIRYAAATAMALMIMMAGGAWSLASGRDFQTAEVTRIKGHQVALKNAYGQILTIHQDPAGISVGDKVQVQNGRIVGSGEAKKLLCHA